jgi:hypothetical protein
MTAQLRTRKPTGLVPYPLIVLAGQEKSGKSYAAYSLSKSERVGRTFVFDLGEAGADEYADLGPYEIVEHNGTFADIMEQLEAAAAVPMVEGKPNVIILDSGTNLWEMCKDGVIKIAEQRAAGKTGKTPDVTVDLWNRAKAQWRRPIDLLMRYEGIAVVTARAGDVTEMDSGKPTKDTTWKVQAEKNLPYDANVIIKTTEPGKAEISGARSMYLTMPPGKNLPVPHFTLEKVVFDMLRAGGGVRDLRTLSSDEVDKKAAKWALVEAFMASGIDKTPAMDAAHRLWGNRTGASIPRTELDQLLASIPTGGDRESPFADDAMPDSQQTSLLAVDHGGERVPERPSSGPTPQVQDSAPAGQGTLA